MTDKYIDMSLDDVIKLRKIGDGRGGRGRQRGRGRISTGGRRGSLTGGRRGRFTGGRRGNLTGGKRGGTAGGNRVGRGFSNRNKFQGPSFRGARRGQRGGGFRRRGLGRGVNRNFNQGNKQQQQRRGNRLGQRGNRGRRRQDLRKQLTRPRQNTQQQQININKSPQRGRGRANRRGTLTRNVAIKRLQNARRALLGTVKNRRALAREKILNLRRGLQTTETPKKLYIRPGLVVGGMRADQVQSIQRRQLIQQKIYKANAFRQRKRSWGTTLQSANIRGGGASNIGGRRGRVGRVQSNPGGMLTIKINNPVVATRRQIDRSVFHKARLNPTLQAEIAALQGKGSAGWVTATPSFEEEQEIIGYEPAGPKLTLTQRFAPEHELIL